MYTPHCEASLSRPLVVADAGDGVPTSHRLGTSTAVRSRHTPRLTRDIAGSPFVGLYGTAGAMRPLSALRAGGRDAEDEPAGLVVVPVAAPAGCVLVVERGQELVGVGGVTHELAGPGHRGPRVRVGDGVGVPASVRVGE